MSIARGAWLNAATAREPAAVLGSAAAQRLGIDRVWPGERIWAGGRWFYMAGILHSATLAPEIDSSDRASKRPGGSVPATPA